MVNVLRNPRLRQRHHTALDQLRKLESGHCLFLISSMVDVPGRVPRPPRCSLHLLCYSSPCGPSVAEPCECLGPCPCGAVLWDFFACCARARAPWPRAESAAKCMGLRQMRRFQGYRFRIAGLPVGNSCELELIEGEKFSSSQDAPFGRSVVTCRIPSLKVSLP